MTNKEINRYRDLVHDKKPDRALLVMQKANSKVRTVLNPEIIGDEIMTTFAEMRYTRINLKEVKRIILLKLKR